MKLKRKTFREKWKKSFVPLRHPCESAFVDGGGNQEHDTSVTSSPLSLLYPGLNAVMGGDVSTLPNMQGWGYAKRRATRGCAQGGPLNFETFDALYVERLRQGDDATERHFHAYFSELITLKLRSRLQSRQAIEDVRQETFSRVFALLRSEGGVRQAERLGAMVNSVCNNVLFEYYRASKRVDPLDDAEANRLVDGRFGALAEVISAQTTAVVREVLSRLNEKDKSILRGVFLEDRDKDEVCRELGVDRGYMRVLLHRAKSSFRAQYEKRTGRP